jgi:uncharacterized protein YjcR
MSLSRNILEELCNEQKLSMAEIAERLKCSPNKVAYWMVKYGIQRRNISQYGTITVGIGNTRLHEIV